MGKKSLGVLFKTVFILACIIFAGSAVRGAENPILYLSGAPDVCKPGDEFEVTVVIEGVDTLYGVEITVNYDSTVLAAIDGDSTLEGINLKNKAGFDTVYENKYLEGNESTKPIYRLGEARFTALNSTAMETSGRLEIATMYFKVIGQGDAVIMFDKSAYDSMKMKVLYEKNGRKIEEEPAGDGITVKSTPDGTANISPKIYIYGPEPETINPTGTSQEVRYAEFKYRISENATATAEIVKKNTDGTENTVKTIFAGKKISAGSSEALNTVTWDGTGDGTISTGDYSLRITAIDSDKNATVEVGSNPVHVDVTPPVVTLDGIRNKTFSPNGDYIRDNFSAVLKSSEDGTAVVVAISASGNTSGETVKEIFSREIVAGNEYTVVWDGKTSAQTAAPDGVYRIRATVYDLYGNKKIEHFKYLYLDTKAPVLTPKSPTVNGWTSDSKPKIEGIISLGTDAGSTPVDENYAVVGIDNKDYYAGIISDNNIISYTPDYPLANGTHSVTVKVADLAGNVAESSWSFDVLRTPKLTALSVYSKMFNPDNGKQMSVKVLNEWQKAMNVYGVVYSGGSIVATIAEQTIAAGESQDFIWDGKWTKDGAAHEGKYTIYFIDKNTKTTSSAVDCFVDLTGPVVTIDESSLFSNGTILLIKPGSGEITIVYSQTDNYSSANEVKVKIYNSDDANYGSIVERNANVPTGIIRNFEWGGMISGQLVGSGVYRIGIEAEDDAGNVGSASVYVTVDRTGPEMSLVYPAEGADAGATSFTGKVRVTDNTGGAGVDAAGFAVSVDGAAVDAASLSWDESTGVLSFPVTLTGNGKILSVTAADSLGNVTTSEWTLNVDTGGVKSVKVVSPSAGTVLSGTVTINGYADCYLIDKMDMYVGGTLAATVSGSITPAFSWDTTAADAGTAMYPDGEYEIKLIATDLAGNTKESAVLTVTVDNTAPAVTGITLSGDGALRGMFSAADGATVKDVRVTPSVTEANGYTWHLLIGSGTIGQADWVELYSASEDVAVGGAPAGLVWDGKKSSDGTAAVDGTYMCIVWVTDAGGLNSSLSADQVKIESTPPALSVVSPADGDMVAGTVTIQTAATDANPGIGAGGVSYTLSDAGAVTMDAGAVSGEYEKSWVTAAADDGNYTLTVTASDMLGNKTVSAPIEFTVANTPASVTNESDTPDPFSPNGDGKKDGTQIQFAITTNVAVDIEWRMEIGNDAGGTWQAVRSLPEPGPTAVVQDTRVAKIGPLSWDGKDTLGNTVADGVYQIKVYVNTYADYPNGTPLASVEKIAGTVTVDNTAPAITSLLAAPADYFSPNGDGAYESVTLTAETGETVKFGGGLNIYCAAGNAACTAAYGSGSIFTASADFTPVAGSDISFVWDGKAADGTLVPDGGYRGVIIAEDAAGNGSSGEVAFAKDNPPVITVAKAKIGFSPVVGAGAAIINWSNDQDGVFGFELYNSGKSYLETLTADNSAAAGAHTYSWDGGGRADGKYYIKITGRDATTAGRENPCVPVWVEVFIDGTPPVVGAFFPEQDEFAELKPRIKLSISDTGSGFDTEAADMTEVVAIAVDGNVLTDPQLTAIESETENAYRAWAVAADGLTVGPHTLTATVKDLVGNQTTLESPVTFYAIEPVEADFEGTEVDWTKVMKVGSTGAGTTNDITVENGALKMIYKDPNNSTTPLGVGLLGFSDVTRKRFEIEAKGIYLNCPSTVTVNCDGGIYLGAKAESGGGTTMVGDSGYHVAFAANYTAWQAYGTTEKLMFGYGAYGGNLATGPKMSTVYGSMEKPIDLKIVYEEGAFEYYYKPSSRPESGYVLVGRDYADVTHIMPALILYNNSSTTDAVMTVEEARTNIAQPVLSDLHVKNLTTGVEAQTTIIYNEESFEIEVEGTPWQKEVTVVLENAGNANYSPYKGNKPSGAVVYGPYTLTETTVGAGIYSTGSLPADKRFDKNGFEARYLVSFAYNSDFDVIPIYGVDMTPGYDMYGLVRGLADGSITQTEAQQIMMSKLLAQYTEAVQTVTLSNLDGPSGYTYILPGEKYKIKAETKTGDWAIQAYLVNPETYLTDAENAVIAGPLSLTKVADGDYEATGILNSIIDAAGNTASYILAFVVYGPASNPEMKGSVNALMVGEPPIRSVVVSNADRPGAADVVEGETVQVTAVGMTGLEMMAGLMNLGNPDPDAFNVVGTPVVMTESPAGSKKYTATVSLKMLKDWSGADVAEVYGVAISPVVELPDGSPDYAAASTEQLTTISGDRTAPEPPSDVVVMPDQEEAPQAGETVSSTVSWTPPALNEDGTSTSDLAGYQIYRVSKAAGSGSLGAAAGSPALSLSKTNGGYDMADTSLEYNGTSYSGTLVNGGAAGLLTRGGLLLTPLPLTDTQLIAAGSDVTGCVVVLNLTGMIYGKGAYKGTVYTQYGRESVERWIERLADVGIAGSGGAVDACATAFESNSDGSFTPAAALPALAYYVYTAAGSASADTYYADTYSYADAVYPYAVAAKDKTGNVSLPSRIGSTVLSSKDIFAAAELSNVASSVPTGYIQSDESYAFNGTLSGTAAPDINLYLINETSIETGASFTSAVVDGPVALSAQNGTYEIERALSTLLDASGETATSLKAVVRISGSGELMTASDELRGGLAPLRAVAIDNNNRPGKGEIRIGETAIVTGEGNAGLALTAAFVNPDNEALIGDEFALTETPAGSGHYEGEAVVVTVTDGTGATSDKLGAVVSASDDSVPNPVPSSENLLLKPVPALTGTVAVQPVWIKTGWGLSADYTISNSDTEDYGAATLIIVVKSADGTETEVAQKTVSLSSGASDSGTFDISAQYLDAGTYTIELKASINDYTTLVAEGTFEVVEDVFSGTVAADKASYIEGEAVAIEYNAVNVSGKTVDAADITVRLKAVDGTILATVPGQSITSAASGATVTGTVQMTAPTGVDGGVVTVEVIATIGGKEDSVAAGIIEIQAPQIIVTGVTKPTTITSNQEPAFEYQLTNRTLAEITDGYLSGVIVDSDYADGDPIYASFNSVVSGIGVMKTSAGSVTFSPVQANPGTYKIIVYFKADSGATPVQVFESTVIVESCGM